MPQLISVSQRLLGLQHILQNLPSSLPEPDIYHSRFQFVDYVPDPEDVDMVGTPEGAINRALEITFGWEARLKGLLPIEERGRGICSLVDVLRAYQQCCQDPESGDAILAKWIDDIWEGACQAYLQAGQVVSICVSMKIQLLVLTALQVSSWATSVQGGSP